MRLRPAIFGLALSAALSERHSSSETKDVVKSTVALIATMGALVLSLLIASAESAYDTRSNQLTQVSADVMVLDRMLARYGPETMDARTLLRVSFAAALERFWPVDGGRRLSFEPTGSPVEALHDKISDLSPEVRPNALCKPKP
jgi:hypothetical protein